MRLSSRILITLLSVTLACATVCVGQAKDGIQGHVFRHNEVGMTYKFPERFSPRVESEMPSGDPSGRQHMILALWSTPERTGEPRMAFVFDKMIRPAGRSREEMADRYLDEVRKMWVNVTGARISGPKQISPAGYAIWRLDLWQPANPPDYLAAIVIPLADRRLLLVQANAPSQSELDAEVDSLRELHLDNIK